MAHQTGVLSHTNQANLSTPGELRVADLSGAQGLTDRFDQIIQTLCNTEVLHEVSAIKECSTRFCHHVRRALNADTAYLCNRTSLSLVTTSSDTSARSHCEDTQDIHAALTAMISDLWNCEAPLCPPDIKVFPEEAHFSYSIFPLDTQHDHLLIVVNPDLDKTLVGNYLADTLTAIYEAFLKNKTTVLASSECETAVLDKLQHKYRLSSKTMTRRRLDLFQNQLKTQAVEFEGLSLVSKSTKPGALSTKLPASLYETSELWNDSFKAKLDCHALIESAHGYKTLCDNENLEKFSDSRLLKIRVHAETLSNPAYSEALQDLSDKAVIHASRLTLDVIPQKGKPHAESLRKLCDRFNIPLPSKIKLVKPTVNLADEFDLMQTNGVSRSSAKKKARG